MLWHPNVKRFPVRLAGIKACWRNRRLVFLLWRKVIDADATDMQVRCVGVHLVRHESHLVTVRSDEFIRELLPIPATPQGCRSLASGRLAAMERPAVDCY